MQNTSSSSSAAGSTVLGLARRLTIIVVLALAVSGATYAVSVSPFVPATTTTRRPPVAATSAQTTAPAVQQSGAASESAVTQAPAPQGRPNGGGGRGPNLTRGLPELGMHAGVIAVIVLLGAGVQMLLRRFRREQGSRAPIFVHQTASGSIRG